MRLIKARANIRIKLKRPVLAIGIFDGVHRGHQQIIRQVVRRAKRLKGTSLALTFYPHPAKILSHLKTTPLITSLKHRIDLISQLGVDVCLILQFNQRLAQMSARRFVQNILVKQIGISYLIIGRGFRFGKDQTGGLGQLRRMAESHNFRLRQIAPVRRQNKIVSSSRIRRLIQSGDIVAANKLLGRKFSLYGRVRRGCARGKILGFPTANIVAVQEVVPAYGVYAVLVKFSNRLFPGVLNIGLRPTFDRKRSSTHVIEVHIFNFQNNIYGKQLEVFFLQRIRDEKRFSSRAALRAQIVQDVIAAQKICRSRSPLLP